MFHMGFMIEVPWPKHSMQESEKMIQYNIQGLSRLNASKSLCSHDIDKTRHHHRPHHTHPLVPNSFTFKTAERKDTSGNPQNNPTVFCNPVKCSLCRVVWSPHCGGFGVSGNTSVQPRRISLVQVQPAPGVKPEVCNRGGAWLCPGPASPPQDQADAFSTQVPDPVSQCFAQLADCLVIKSAPSCCKTSLRSRKL